ncbi:MAG: Rossmann-like and DUF2520 domain-containing protein [Thermodesulfobacteriota bacterium]
MKPSFAVIGCGKVGSALAARLTAAGYPLVGAASRTIESARKLGCHGESVPCSTSPWEVTSAAEIVLITTPDGLIEKTCREIADRQGFKENAVVLHCSGVLPSTILSTAESGKASIGSLHPLQSFAGLKVHANPFAGIIIAIEGQGQALSTARQMAEDLGARCLPIKTEAKTLYHAAAVMASNYLVTLQASAIALLQEAGIPRQEAFSVLKPLLQGTLANIEKLGVDAALTGPIARGDLQTVGNHVAAIGRFSPVMLELYNVLGRHTIPIARKAGIPETVADALARMLAEEPQR